MNFGSGHQCRGAQNVTIPVTVQDIYEEDIPSDGEPKWLAWSS